MAPSLFALGTAALVLAGDAAAKQFVLYDTYDSTNFFDKFDFFESKYGTGNFNDVDLTSGYINYRTRVDAQKLGLINNAGGEIYLGPDTQNVTEFPGVGRSSVKLESKAIYNKSLMVARFSHLPKPVCGAWPAFWSYGAPWPQKGELDWFEGWNNAAANKPAAHTYHSEEQGQCIISDVGQTSKVNTANCDQLAPGQYQNEGCGVTATSADPWGSADGGIYAVEWTDEYIKFFAWTHDAAPKDIGSESPDTSSWGTPSMLISNDKCNIKSHFSDQRLVINIDFCGVLAGNEFVWKDQCATSTGHAVCSTYVAQNPSVYKDTYFKIKDIRVFKEGSKPVISTSASASASASVSAVSASNSHSQTGTTHVTDKSARVSDSQTAIATAKVTDKSASVTATGTAAGTTTASASVTKFASATGTVPISIKPGSVADEDVCSEDGDGPTTKTAVPTKDVVTDKSAVVSGSDITNKQTHAVPTTAAQLTTSTVCTTKVSTVTACPPTVADCPGRIGKVITETIALYTTVCPISLVPAPKPTEPARGNNHNQHDNDKSNPSLGISTTTFTTVYTVKKSIPAAGPSVPVITKSIPVAGPSVPLVTKIAVPSGPNSVPSVTKTLSQISSSGPPPKPSAPSGSPHGYNATAPVVKPSTPAARKPSGTAPGASTAGCFGPSCPTKPVVVVVNDAVQPGASFALMALGVLAVFFM
ncbi:beta-1,3-endoglucanase [Colletotrichum zoysiae]|uniref:Beta-1,3-endoglucanase n=1 Tax=Colletotrichum zoysiae TaxID=1216348 RepID=A0AAD9HUN9_9PEZI|nr:beta-1,3-endoglucanase [Colletotrichum zoysiae]